MAEIEIGAAPHSRRNSQCRSMAVMLLVGLALVLAQPSAQAGWVFRYVAAAAALSAGHAYARDHRPELEKRAKSSETIGKVVYVDDGDTVVLLVDGKSQRKVRLSSIDAPESSHTSKERGRIGQPYSDNSGKYLASLVKGKNVEAHCFEADRYGRDVCELFVDGRSVNREMVRQGWAWANVAAHGRYLRDKSLPELEAKARSNHAGLWAGSHPVAPWEWRDICWKQGRCVP